MCVSYLLSLSASSHFLSLLAVKGISYTTLIRLGVLWGKGVGAFEKGTFDIHWGCHPLDHVAKLYNDIIAAFKRQPDGPSEALSILIGKKNARTFCLELGLPVAI